MISYDLGALDRGFAEDVVDGARRPILRGARATGQDREGGERARAHEGPPAAPNSRHASRRPELGECDLRRHVLEHHLHGHADADRVWRAADDVRHHAHALLQLDDRQHVGQLLAEAGRLVLVGHGEAVDRAAPARPHPLGRRREASGAERTRVEALGAAVAAALEVELVAGERFPVAPRLLVDARQRLAVGLRLRHQARPRSMVTPLWRCPSMPPVPWTRTSFASFTCRGPHSPRSCRVASMTRKMPRMPGWLEERPPPSGFTGSAPPRPIRPPAQKAPPSPGAQKPSASSVASTVIVYES